ncbi:MAG TPA: hypothetical protein VI911_11435 [Patescibacteria group bacterium]|nr:hypothetical protein [Patescibacteria group bacterium]
MTYSRSLAGSISTAPQGDEGLNSTGSSLNKATPVSINHTSGEVDIIDVSNEASARASFAVVREDSADGQPVEYISNGRLKDVSLSFDYSDVIYVSKLGSLTNIAPSVGVGGFVSGDFIVRVGIIAKNLSDPLKKDLVIDMEVEGQLE